MSLLFCLSHLLCIAQSHYCNYGDGCPGALRLAAVLFHLYVQLKFLLSVSCVQGRNMISMATCNPGGVKNLSKSSINAPSATWNSTTTTHSKASRYGALSTSTYVKSSQSKNGSGKREGILEWECYV